MIRISAICVLVTLMFSCKEGKETQKTTSPRIRKNTSVTSPSQNQVITRGTEIAVSIDSNDDYPIDSIQVSVDGISEAFNASDFSFSIPNRKVGEQRIRIKVFSGSDTETHQRKVVILSETAPEELTYEIQNTYPHNTDDYTQGLLIKDGWLFESTGQTGKSTFKKKNLESGEDIQVVNLASELFGEGLAEFNNEFYQLTWTSGQGFVYNENMEQVRTFSYQVQGWGLTTIGNELVLTDETEKLYYVDPESFTISREIQVYDDEGKIDSLNELEVIDGLIYANVYQEDFVVVVDPETGEVLQKIDFTGLLSDEEAREADVLNGIAYDSETGRIFVTGKWWPKLFEVTFEPKTIQ